MTDEQTRKTSELLIELKVTVEHLTRRVEDALNRTDDNVKRLERQVEKDMNEVEQRLRVLERMFWLAGGALILIQIALPFIRELIKQ